MRILVVLAFVFSGSWAVAEKKTIKIKGMHCKGCVEMIEGEVCEAQKFKTCKVRLATGEKNMGEIELETEGKALIDMKKIKATVSEVGEYTVIE